MRAFIDDFQLIRVESQDYIYQISIQDNHINWVKNEGFNQFFALDKPIDFQKNDKIWINDCPYPLEIGIVTLTKAFEQKYRYDGHLGVIYHPDHTIFRLFSPVASEVILSLGDDEYVMNYIEPIWEIDIRGDQKNKPYVYKIRLVDTYKEVKDPYTMACTTTSSVVIDWSDTIKIDPTPIKVKHYVDAVIYEGHVRDMTINLDVESKGTFLGLTEYSKTLKSSVLSYIKKLGMTHLQLLPVFDFGGVDDMNKDLKYNWGYNPEQYFAIDGFYSTDPDDPYERINSFKKVISEAHKIGLGINMDVVYNHVYEYDKFPYDDIVPGYFYRHDAKHKMTNASYCGNDIETRNYMVRKLIVDSLIHFTKNFSIDGFRFDLMGLLDIDTMLLIEKELKKINPYIMLYGEGWNMATEVPPRYRANMQNHQAFMSYAHFNDGFRNTFKGELHGPGIGYANGNLSLTHKAMDCLLGSPSMFLSPNQSINYVECHDNLTFYDKMLLSSGFEKPEFKINQDFINHVIAISQGVPFYHAGQEFYRSKKGVENSYNSPDDINQIHWNIHTEGVKKLRKLLSIRKQYKAYRQTEYLDNVTVQKDQNIIIYTIDTKRYKLIHYIKPYPSIERFPLYEGKLLFPSQKVLNEEHHIYVDHPGVYIVLIKK